MASLSEVAGLVTRVAAVPGALTIRAPSFMRQQSVHLETVSA